MTRTLRNFDSAGEDQVTSMMGRAQLDDGQDGFDPPARERPAVSALCIAYIVAYRSHLCG